MFTKNALLRSCLATLFFSGFALSRLSGAIGPGSRIEELELQDGSVLKNVTFVSFGTGTVMAKWEGGRGTIAYILLPADVLSDMKPAIPETKPQPAPVDNRTETQKKIDEFRLKRDSEIREALNAPEPKRPEMPAKLVGSIGLEDGKEKVIRGQCFVTTRGGINYKLGVVIVRVVGSDEFKELQKEAMTAFRPTLDFYYVMAKRAEGKKNFDLASVYLERVSATLNSLSIIFPFGPQSQTDADGNFELRHKLREPYVVSAAATRAVGSKTEYYEWVVPSSEIGSDGKLLLSNANMK